MNGNLLNTVKLKEDDRKKHIENQKILLQQIEENQRKKNSKYIFDNDKDIKHNKIIPQRSIKHNHNNIPITQINTIESNENDEIEFCHTSESRVLNNNYYNNNNKNNHQSTNYNNYNSNLPSHYNYSPEKKLSSSSNQYLNIQEDFFDQNQQQNYRPFHQQSIEAFNLLATQFNINILEEMFRNLWNEKFKIIDQYHRKLDLIREERDNAIKESLMLKEKMLCENSLNKERNKLNSSLKGNFI